MLRLRELLLFFFFSQAEDGIRDYKVTGVQTCALPIWVDHRQALALAEAEVLLAERDRRVHQTGAILRRDKVGGQDGVSLGTVGVGGDVLKRRLVGGADQLAAGERREHLALLA